MKRLSRSTDSLTPAIPIPARENTVTRLWNHVERWNVGDLTPELRHNLRIDTMAAMLFGVFLAGLNFIPVILRNMGAAPEWIAFYLSQIFIGYMLTFLTARFIPADHKLMRAGQIIWITGRLLFALIGLITGVEALVMLTLIFWILESLPVPIYTRLMQMVYPDEVRARAISFVRVCLAIVMLMATPVVGWVLDNFGYQVLLPVCSIFGVCSTLLFGRIRLVASIADPHPDIPAVSPPANTRNGVITLLKKDRRFTYYISGLIIFGIGFLAITPLFPLVQVDRLGLSYTFIGGLGVVQSIFFMLGYLVLGRMIDHHGGIYALRRAFLFGVVLTLSFAFAQSGWLLIPAFAALGLVNAGMDVGSLNSVIQLAGKNRVSDYSAAQMTIMGIRGLIAPFIGVTLIKIGVAVNTVFLLGAVLMILSGGLLMAAERTPYAAEPND